MSRRPLKIGDRVRLKPGASTMSGWRGCGTVVAAYPGSTVIARKDDELETAEACEWEWALMRDQTPNPCHLADVVDLNVWMAARP